jgi:hypothetical protein
MGISGQSSRPGTLLWLAGLVVVFGGVSWFVTREMGVHGAPPIHSHPATITPGPTPTPLDCPSNQLALVGAFNECAQTVPDATSTCSVSGHILNAALRLGGSPDAFLLYIEVNGAFAGPGSSYALPPWPHPMGTPGDVPKVAVQQDGTSAFWQLVDGAPVRRYDTDALWQSVAGILTVTGSDGRSGTVSGILALSAGNNSTARGATLSVKWTVELSVTYSSSPSYSGYGKLAT